MNHRQRRSWDRIGTHVGAGVVVWGALYAMGPSDRDDEPAEASYRTEDTVNVCFDPSVATNVRQVDLGSPGAPSEAVEVDPVDGFSCGVLSPDTVLTARFSLEASDTQAEVSTSGIPPRGVN